MFNYFLYFRIYGSINHRFRDVVVNFSPEGLDRRRDNARIAEILEEARMLEDAKLLEDARRLEEE